MGVKNVVLLEQHKLTAGTTWHTAGLLWHLTSHDLEMELIKHTRELMTDVLPKETGLETGWIDTGGLFTAYRKERLDAYKEMATLAKVYGMDAQMLSPYEINDIHPLVDVSNLIGAVYSPMDGTMDPAGTCLTYTRAAAKYGAKPATLVFTYKNIKTMQILENCDVTGIETKVDDYGIKRIVSVSTNHGVIKTRNIVNCTGVWAPYIGKVSKYFSHIQTRIRGHRAYTWGKQGSKLQGSRQFNLPEAARRYAANWWIRVKPNTFRLWFSTKANTVKPLIGLVDLKAVLARNGNKTPKITLYTANLVQVFRMWKFPTFAMKKLSGRTNTLVCRSHKWNRPAFGQPFVDQVTKCRTALFKHSYASESSNDFPMVFAFTESFTSDQKPLVGESPDVRGFFYGSGFNSAGMMYGGGAGREIANWIIHGRPSIDMFSWDIRYYNNEKHEDYTYNELLQQDYTFDFPGSVHQQIAKESLTCRTSGAMFNTSYMGKLFLTGEDAGVAARYLFTRDCQSKQADDYYMTVGGATTEYCKGHLSDKLNGLGLKCSVDDRTNDMGILSLQGPRRSKLDLKISVPSCSNPPIPQYDIGFPCSREILEEVVQGGNIRKLKFSRWTSAKVAGLPVLIMRISFVGELGYELHCSMRDMPTIYQALMHDAERYGVCDSGYRAMESLSTEVGEFESSCLWLSLHEIKIMIGFHHWGHSIRTDDNPLEARLMNLCDPDAVYVGSEAVNNMRETTPNKILCCFTVDEPVQLFGHEAIRKNNEIVGYTRNAVHGF
uniref:FAD dependent oxidoreductase domain-containing protein n=1 Tax=Ciona savignyi TaxID=51511 RepID=H2YWY6_CIOSA